MPVIDPNDIDLVGPDDLVALYVRSNHHFMLQVRKLSRTFHGCDRVVERSRLLQLIGRPSWQISYNEGQGSETFRRSIAASLERIGATFTFFRHGSDPIRDDKTIVLTHHSRGQRKNLWHYKMAYLPFMFHLDRTGYSGWSEFRNVKPAEIEALDQATVDAFFAREVSEILGSRATKHPQGAEAAPEATDFVFFALQVPNDSVISLCFQDDYIATLRQAILAIRQAGETVVVKPHPFGRQPRLMAMLQKLTTEGVIVTDASIHALLPRAKAVVTANSGVGFEALLHDKPVLCLAQADYGHAAVEVRDAAAADAALAEALAADRRDFARKTVYAMMTRYQVDLRAPEAMDRHVLRLLCDHLLGDSGRRG